MEHLETVKVVDRSPGGTFMIINKVDFDPEVHELVDKPPVKLTIDQIRKELIEREVDFDAGASKADLLALLNANPAK